jgi:hypothetical protein
MEALCSTRSKKTWWWWVTLKMCQNLF